MYYLDYETELSKMLETVTVDSSSDMFLVNRDEFMTDLLNSVALDHTCRYLNCVYNFFFLIIFIDGITFKIASDYSG